ncbi:hypothetical protein HPB52_023627 [Rhipicephalus sanguineus]|uniref:Peptidase M13 N-terminal domain-containing protein n=1 Tax=Rhipicephalus sanguineus TaxID=34632 RepID=A0A9D4PSU7_RHISA|nr:hypothetical protein HPB52_023627 [Rhipicephalus sanguineus]
MFLPGVSNNACKSHECREYGRRLAASLNTSVSPCDSFTNFVCDGWRRDNMLSVHDDLVWETIDRIRRLVERIKVPDKGQNDLQRATAAFKSCYDVAQGTRNELPAVRQALLEAGITWPHRPASVDVLHVLLYTSAKLGWDAFLRVIPTRVDGRHAIVIGRGASFVQLFHQFATQRSFTEKKDYFYALKNSFENDDVGDEVTFREMMDIEYRAMGELSQVYNDTTASVDLPPNNFSQGSFESLSESSWRRVLAEHDFNVTGDFFFRVLTLKYVQAFVELWAFLGEVDVYWLVSWGTVQVAALYANQDLILKFYGGTKVWALVRQGAFCLSRAYRFSKHALSNRYGERALNMYTLSAAGGLVLRIREAVHQQLSKWVHYDEGIAVVANWSSLDTPFGAFRSQSEADESHEASHSEPSPSLDLGDSFVANWRKSVLVADWSQWDDAVVSAMASLEFAALWPGEDFQIMPYSLSFLHFNVDLIAALNYGGLGLGVAQALGMLLVSAYLQNASKHRYIHATLECIMASSFSHGQNPVHTMAEIITSKAVIDTYMSGARQDGDDRLVGLEFYDNLQLLFIAACYLKCVGMQEGSIHGLCDMSFQFVPEFAEVFGCTPGTRLNPRRQCKLLGT